MSSKVFRPHVYDRLRHASREQLLKIAAEALEVAYPPMFRQNGTGRVQVSDGLARVRLQRVFEEMFER